MDIARIVADIAGVRGEFPDLDFLNPAGVLRVPIDHPPVTAIRLQVPGETWFHLHSLDLTTDRKEWRSHATWTTSSRWGEFTPPPSDAFFDPAGTHATAFHCDLEPDPWVEVVFDTPIKLDVVWVRNIPSPTASRARGMQVLLSTSGGTWTSVYDGRARVQLLRRVLRGRDTYGLEPVAEANQSVGAIALDMAVGAYDRSSHALDRLDLVSDEERRRLRREVSDQLLAPRELEWTSHGVKRSFRFWKPEEKRDYVRLAVQITEHLSQLTPRVCFGFGAALAVVRDGDLIPHDDDLDLLVAFEPHEAATLAAGHRLVTTTMQDAGYTVTGDFLAHRKVALPDHQRGVDVFVGIFEGDRIAWYPGTRGSLHRDTMFPVSSGPLLGISCPLPRSPLDYLETVYGPEWRQPDPGFRHRWYRPGFADIAGDD